MGEEYGQFLVSRVAVVCSCQDLKYWCKMPGGSNACVGYEA